MSKYLVVVDMQKDFIDGALGTAEAQAIVPKVIEKVTSFKGPVMFTRDTHEENYLETQEGQNLPVKHCIATSAMRIVLTTELRASPFSVGTSDFLQRSM